MRWVGYWVQVHKFSLQWFGSGQLFGGLDWAENRLTDNSAISPSVFTGWLKK